MHDYMKALYHRFDSPAEREEKLELVAENAEGL